MMNRHLRRAIIASIASAGLITPPSAELWVPPKPGIIRADEYKTLPVIPSLITMGMLAKKPAAAGVISFINVASAGATSVALPAHVTGDVILIWAGLTGNTPSPSLPAGYTNLGSGGGADMSYRIGYKIATSSSETSGTWTGANRIAASIYRGVSGIGTVSGDNNSVSTVASWLGITLQVTDGTSWVVSLGGTGGSQNFTSTPGTRTNRLQTGNMKVMDTNAGVATAAGHSSTISGSERWNTRSVELKA